MEITFGKISIFYCFRQPKKEISKVIKYATNILSISMRKPCFEKKVCGGKVGQAWFYSIKPKG